MPEEDFKVGFVVSGDTASIYKLPEKEYDFLHVSVITEQMDDDAVSYTNPIKTFREKTLPILMQAGAEITYFGMDPIESEGE